MSMISHKQQLKEDHCNLKEEREAHFKYLLALVCLFAFCLVILEPALGVVFARIKDWRHAI